MNFKCNECGSEVINIILIDTKITRFKSLGYLPETLSDNWLKEEIWDENNADSIIAECDGCNQTWRALDLDGLKTIMLQQGVIYDT